LNLLSPRMLPSPGFLSDCGLPKLPKAPIGAKPAAGGAAHGNAAPPGLKGAVVVRFKVPKGPVFSAGPLSLSRSSPAAPDTGSLKSVRRRIKEGGGVTAPVSSRANREAAGDAGNGYASPVSRRRLPGRAVVGEDKPYGVPGPWDIDDLRKERGSLGVPSLLVFWVGGFSGELTDDRKT
jgi:hypothetical protein